MRYFNETKEETIGDFHGNEERAVAIIDTIFEKIEDMILEEYGDVDIEVENTNEIQNMVWEHVCDYSEDLSETDEDYIKTAESVYSWVQIRAREE